jgi:hypothetical protein
VVPSPYPPIGTIDGDGFQTSKRKAHSDQLMSRELKRLLIERLVTCHTGADRRLNPKDRRKLNTYVLCDRRSGVADRRAKTSELIKRFLYKYRHERRQSGKERRKLSTFIMNDRRSGIEDRRSGF